MRSFTLFCNCLSLFLQFLLGYFESEIKKEKITIPLVNHHPEAPAPRDIIDLEVCGLILISIVFGSICIAEWPHIDHLFVVIVAWCESYVPSYFCSSSSRPEPRTGIERGSHEYKTCVLTIESKGFNPFWLVVNAVLSHV